MTEQRRLAAILVAYVVIMSQACPLVAHSGHVLVLCQCLKSGA